MGTVLSIFPSELGWLGVAGRDGHVMGVCFGHARPLDAERRLTAEFGSGLEMDDWHPELRRRLQAYAQGAADEFQDIAVDVADLTPFQQRVIRELRRVGYGQTVSYGELAQRVGAPRSARAVGRVMATNRVPILLPCHRVVASGGGLGGFSAPQGIPMKLRLLQLEGASGFATRHSTSAHEPVVAQASG